MPKITSFLTLGLFFISMLSGLVIVFAYHPSLAFQSVQQINYLIPYGSFFRKLHYFSSELFTLFLLLHVSLELIKRKINIAGTSWNFSVLGLIFVIVLMFSGFVLKADLSANAAAQVAYNLIKDTPFLKGLLNLVQDTTVFYYKFFIWHILFLPLLLGYTIFKHINSLHVKIEYLSIALGITVLALMFFTMPQDIIPGEKIQTLTSPWFFQGAENLLLNSWSAVSINLFLSFPFFLFFAYYYTRYKKSIKILLSFWLAIYMLVSLFLK